MCKFKLRRWHYLFYLWGILLLLGSPPSAHAEAPARKPNFVFILVDDMGWTDAACLGSTFYETPHIDRLAASGTRFTTGYAAAPVCSPTRASILTGKFPARLGTTDWFGGGNRKGKLLPAPYRNHLPLEEMTIAQVLKNAGYRTAFVGKWHLGSKGFEPTRFGFASNHGGNERGSPPSYFSPYKNPNLTDGPPGEELTDRLTSEALSFIQKNKDAPFLLYLSYYAVHTPLQAKKDLVSRFQVKAAKLPERQPFAMLNGTKVRQLHDHAVYAAMVATLDSNVGRILAQLTELGLADDTVVIFTSDNGGLSTSEGWPTSNRPLRVGKGWLYEGGLRVPFIIRWPGHGKPGTVIDHPVISTDFFPTMLEMANLLPQAKQHVDGLSLVPLLRQQGQPPDRPLFWHYPHYSNQGGAPSSAVRAGDFMLIEFLEDGRLELYNVRRDLEQHRNLAPAMPDLTRRLQQQLHEWRQTLRVQMPLPNPNWKGGKKNQ